MAFPDIAMQIAMEKPGTKVNGIILTGLSYQLPGFSSGELKVRVSDVEMPCFWLEAKRHKRVNIKSALKQAQETAPKGRWPIAITKDDFQPVIATMYLSDFLELLEQWWWGQNR